MRTVASSPVEETRVGGLAGRRVDFDRVTMWCVSTRTFKWSQELRVTPTGLQILTGFLVTLPLQRRFEGVEDRQRLIYLVTLSTLVLATAVVPAKVGS